MNGLTTFLAPLGDMPVVMGMAGRPPGSAETQTETDGFLGILQQMIGGSAQMASLLTMLPVLSTQNPVTDGGIAPSVANGPASSVIDAAASSVAMEQPDVLPLLPSSTPGPSPPGITEVVSLVSPPPVSDAAVVEQLASPEPRGQVTGQQQQTVTPGTGQGEQGSITLPVTVAALPEGADPLVAEPDVRLPGAPSLPRNDVSAVADDRPVERGEKAAPPVKAVAAVPPPKPAHSVRVAEPALLQTGKQSEKGLSTGEVKHAGDAGRLPARPEVLPPVEPDARPVLTSVSVARGTTPEERETGEKLQQGSVGKPVQAKPKAEFQEERTPAPVTAEEIPAKAVVSAKPVGESDVRDGETGKPAFQPPQITPVKQSNSRVEAGASRLPDFQSALPPETTRSVISQVVKEAAMQVRGETSEMRIRLVPASLGEVTLNVRMEGGQMNAQIDVSHAGVKAALESNMGQLREALSSRGIDVQRLDVYHNDQSMTRNAGGDQGDRYRRQGGKRHSYATDAIEQYDTGRLLGYNTMEVVM